MPALTLIVNSKCHLLNAPGKLTKILKKELTIDNPEYINAKKYGRWIPKNLKRELTFYKECKDSFTFPRGYMKRCDKLSVSTIGYHLIIKERHRTPGKTKFVFKGELRSYQKEAQQDILTQNIGVLVAGTGSGKTVMALSVIAERDTPTLILVHTKELLYQWQERIRTFLEVDPGLIGDNHFEIKNITVAIVHTAKNRIDDIQGKFGQIIVDECHRVPTTLFTEVVTELDVTYLLGLSATAYRRENLLTRVIYFYIGKQVHEVDQDHLTETGAILIPEIIQRPTDFRCGTNIDYQQIVNKLANDQDRNKLIVADILRESKMTTGVCLVVSDRVYHCIEIANMLRGRKRKIAVLTGKTKIDERKKIVAQVQNKKIKILIATIQLIGEGFDEAELETLFLITPIKFSGRLQQTIGRILRPLKNKQPKVFDYIDYQVNVLRNAGKHRGKLYQEIWGTIPKKFNFNEYKDIKHPGVERVKGRKRKK